MIKYLPEDGLVNVSMVEFEHYLADFDRRLYLMSEIASSSNQNGGFALPTASQIVDDIIAYNRQDKNITPLARDPILLYINSPGGDAIGGFAIVSAIKASKTPVWTVNVGQWSSTAFLIGITGHRRLSLRYAMFLMHDDIPFPSAAYPSELEAKMELNKRLMIRGIVLSHSKMKATEYDSKAHDGFCMLSGDAKRFGFIDDIIESLDEII